jgi:hypothetical protein
MLREGRPELVVAFPGGKGTAHMVKLAMAAAVPVRQLIEMIQPEQPPGCSLSMEELYD